MIRTNELYEEAERALIAAQDATTAAEVAAEDAALALLIETPAANIADVAEKIERLAELLERDDAPGVYIDLARSAAADLRRVL